MTVIGLTGFARSGKDTVGRILTEEYGFIRIAFGDVLKQVAEDTDPILEVGGCEDTEPYRAKVSQILECSGGWEGAKDQVPEARQYLVDLGNSLRTRIPGVEVQFTQAMAAEYGDVVNTNVYHPEEIKGIQAHGGVMLRVIRPGYGPANAWEANTAKCPVDATVVNDGGLDKLRVNLDLVLRYLNIGRTA